MMSVIIVFIFIIPLVYFFYEVATMKLETLKVISPSFLNCFRDVWDSVNF